MWNTKSVSPSPSMSWYGHASFHPQSVIETTRGSLLNGEMLTVREGWLGQALRTHDSLTTFAVLSSSVIAYVAGVFTS
jgi:hypothetical protein